MDASFQDIVHWPAARVLQRKPLGVAGKQRLSASTLAPLPPEPARGTAHHFARDGLQGEKADAQPAARSLDSALRSAPREEGPAESSTELRRQLQWLKTQKIAEEKRLKGLTKSASESQLRERRASQAAQRHMDAMSGHQQTLHDTRQAISRLTQVSSTSQYSQDSLMERQHLVSGHASGGDHAVGQSSLRMPAGCTLEEYFASGDVDAGLGHSDCTDTGTALVNAPGSAASKSSRRNVQSPSTDLAASITSSDIELAVDRIDAIRKAVRDELILKVGGGNTRLAFRRMNCTNSGRILLHDFGASLDRFQIDWRALSGLRTERHLFRLFDKNRDGQLEFSELFPDELQPVAPSRVRTPEFCKRYGQAEMSHSAGMARCAKWQLAGLDDELQAVQDAVTVEEHQLQLRQHMKGMMRRFRARGKDDEEIQIVATRHRAPSTYTGDPERRVQKEIGALKEQRRLLHNARQYLYTSCLEREEKQRTEEQMKRSAISGLSMSGGGILNKVRDADSSSADITAFDASGFSLQSLKRAEA